MVDSFTKRIDIIAASKYIVTQVNGVVMPTCLINAPWTIEAIADIILVATTRSRAPPTHRAFIRVLLLSPESDGYIGLCYVIAAAEVPTYHSMRCLALLVAGGEVMTAPVDMPSTLLAGKSHRKSRLVFKMKMPAAGGHGLKLIYRWGGKKTCGSRRRRTLTPALKLLAKWRG